MKSKIGDIMNFVNQVDGGYRKSWIILLIAIIASIVTHSPLCLIAGVWGTIAASSTQSFNFNFVPQFIEFVTTSTPTSFQINVNGDGMVFNLDANGCNGMTHIRAYQRQANSYMYQLADGLLNNKNGSVTIANATAATLTIRYWSPIKTGSIYCTFNPAQALANQGYNLQQYAYASFPSAAATDPFQLTYADGSLDNITREELNVSLGYNQNDTVTTAKYASDNIAPARISQLTFTPAAAQTFYVMKYQPAYGQQVNTNPNVQS
jgi:hypothetical protein